MNIHSFKQAFLSFHVLSENLVNLTVLGTTKRNVLKMEGSNSARLTLKHEDRLC